MDRSMFITNLQFTGTNSPRASNMLMKQRDFIINNISVVLNTDEDGDWMKDVLIILKKDIKNQEITNIINYLYTEGFILDRRVTYKIV